MSLSQVTRACIGHLNQSKPVYTVDMGLAAALGSRAQKALLVRIQAWASKQRWFGPQVGCSKS